MRQSLLRLAARTNSRDPWARREAWRYEGNFARSTVYKNLWPGFSYGVGAFVLYCIGEKLLGSKEEHHDGHSEH